MSLVDALVIAVSGAAAAGAWIYLLWVARDSLRRARLDVFLEYTRRYREIAALLPSDVFGDVFDLESLPDSERESLIRQLRAYFDLCSEELWLYGAGMLDSRIWAEWQSGIRQLLSRPAFVQAWEAIQRQRYFYGEFVQFVGDCQRTGPDERVGSVMVEVTPTGSAVSQQPSQGGGAEQTDDAQPR